MPRNSKLTINYYSDPGCIWSWGYEPVRRKIDYHYAGSITWRPVAGGLLLDNPGGSETSWKFHNWMKAHWQEVPLETRMPAYWEYLDQVPPQSTRIQAEAVAAAAHQEWQYGMRLLRLQREARFLDRVNPFDPDVLRQLAGQIPGLDHEQWQQDLDSDRAAKWAEQGFAETRQPVDEARDINDYDGPPRYGYPTLVWEDPDGAVYTADYETRFEQVCADLEAAGAERANRQAQPLSQQIQSLFERYGRIAVVEVETILGVSTHDVYQALEDLDQEVDHQAIHGQTILTPK